MRSLDQENMRREDRDKEYPRWLGYLMEQISTIRPLQYGPLLFQLHRRIPLLMEHTERAYSLPYRNRSFHLRPRFCILAPLAPPSSALAVNSL